jgi:excisionase family DNA binding protein
MVTTDRLYTTHDISRLLQVDPSTVSKWIDRGILLAYRTPGGHRRVRSKDLRTFLIAHEMPLPDELGSDVVRLVIADDEKSTLEAIKRVFKPYGAQFEITTTGSGIEALLLVSEHRPHGLVIDLNMAEIDGFEVVRQLKSRKALEGVKLIAMTERHTPEVVEKALEAGAVLCLPKPLEVAHLLELFKLPLAMGAKK